MSTSQTKRCRREWKQTDMQIAYQEAKAGHMSIAKASRLYNVPRMTLSDRVNGRVPVNAKMGVSTALTLAEEMSLLNYITYMANKGFPLSVSEICGFAWCIAKEHSKEDVFSEKGPSRKWWQGYKSRHPEITLRRPDALDRGRAAMGNSSVVKDYFSLLKTTLESNDLKDKPERIYNCDEAGIFLNKFSGQRVVVPKRAKHAHTVSLATSEHISVHCCVNAAGAALPPMIIFSGGFPGGAYHKNGPTNAAYATTDSGFMDKETYAQWFDKIFLKHAVKERPLILLQDGAVSHLSPSLVKSAIDNDVVLICLPSKTTHILQPMDVAIYKAMKAEATKQMSHARMLKSDLWVSKKNVSSVFKIIYEKSFTMSTISNGFRKCGIYPFDPNAIDKSLLVRGSSEIVDPNTLDISLDVSIEDQDSTSTQREVLSGVPNMTTHVQRDNSVPESAVTATTKDSTDINTKDLLQDDRYCSNDTNVTTILNLSIGENGILSGSLAVDCPTPTSPIEKTAEVMQITHECPPELAFAAVESALTPRKKRSYEDAFALDTEIKGDAVFNTWKQLREQVARSSKPLDLQTPREHPLVSAGLISDDLASVLLVPDQPKGKQRTKRKNNGRARILSTLEVQKELDDSVMKRQQVEMEKIKRKEERERKRKEKENEIERKKLLKQKKEKTKLVNTISKVEKSKKVMELSKVHAVCRICGKGIGEPDLAFMCLLCPRTFHATCLPDRFCQGVCPRCTDTDLW